MLVVIVGVCWAIVLVGLGVILQEHLLLAWFLVIIGVAGLLLCASWAIWPRGVANAHADTPRVLIEDDSIDGHPGVRQRPMWRVKIRNTGAPIALAPYVESLVGTDHAEEGYFSKWRLHRQRYVNVGEVPQTVDIAQISDDMDALIRAGLRQARNPLSNALNFFSPSVDPAGAFPRQVVIGDGSLRATITALGEDGRVYGRETFEFAYDDVGAPIMQAVLPSAPDPTISLVNEFVLRASHWAADVRTPDVQRRYDDAREKLTLAVMNESGRKQEVLRTFQHDVNAELIKWSDHPASVKVLQNDVIRKLRKLRDDTASRLS